ncbi:hypothetical protein ACFV4N_30550 [Actinosynnema sp. NPDC059797]
MTKHQAAFLLVDLALIVGSALVPFLLGVLLSLHLVRHHETVNRLGFALFMSVALAVTAFPVLARTIADRG